MRFLNKKSGQFVTVYPKHTQTVCALLRSKDYLVVKNDDGEHWITLNGGEGEGQHVLINGQGKVIGGAGGKLTGKELSNVKTKSKNVEKHGPPIPQYPPKPTGEKTIEKEKPIFSPLQEKLQNLTKNKEEAIEGKDINKMLEINTELSHALFDLKSKEDEESKKVYDELELQLQELLSNAGNVAIENIDNLSKKSTFEDKENALLDAQKIYNELRSNRKTVNANSTFWSLYDRISKLKVTVNKEKAKISSAGDLAFNESAKQYEKLSFEDIQKDLKEKYNFDIALGENKAKRKKQYEKMYNLQFSENKEEYEKAKQEYYSSGKSVGSHIRGHTPVDITENTKTAKQQRLIIGKVADSYSDLENRGWNIKEAMESAKVAYTPAGVGKACGHAFQEGGVGYFSISHTKYFDAEYIQQQKKGREDREKANKPRWTIGSGTEYEMQATIIHEMTHALGMQPHIDSPKKLGVLMRQLANEGKLTGFPTEQDNMQANTRINEFIKWKISQYATTNIKETDAELATLVTHPEYVRGTLPKELEDHVDELFKRKKQ